jgi:hypothetical protein
MIRQNGLSIFSANSNQTLTSAMQYVIYTGNGTGNYDYTLPEIGTEGVFGAKVAPGQIIDIRNAGSAANTLNILKHANDTGIILGASGAVTTFILPVGSAVKLIADTSANWYLVPGTNFFDQYDDLEFLTSARAASTNSATLVSIGNGAETWDFQPSTIGGNANKWLMCQRQITHGWNKGPIQFHVHFSPVTDLVATGTGIIVTWTFVWRSFQPGIAQAWTNESNFTMTYALASGTMGLANNYNASVGGNNSDTTVTNAAGSTMIIGRLELTSVTNNSVNQTTELFLNGFDAHMKLRRRGTILPFPEP